MILEAILFLTVIGAVGYGFHVKGKLNDATRRADQTKEAQYVIVIPGVFQIKVPPAM